MPLDDETRLADRLVEVERALLAEFYERLALAGFPDVSLEATGVFKDIDPAGSTIADLASRAQLTESQARRVVADLREHGYLEVEGDHAALTERGWAAVAAGRQALRDVEDAWAEHLGADRFAAFAAVLDDLAAWHRGVV
jgi:DNA-binding MarR family transcriptional regulator